MQFVLKSMTTRNFADKNGNSWTWEETPETIEALKQLHNTVKRVNENKTNTEPANVG
jgi:hypothetical protein